VHKADLDTLSVLSSLEREEEEGKGEVAANAPRSVLNKGGDADTTDPVGDHDTLACLLAKAGMCREGPSLDNLEDAPGAKPLKGAHGTVVKKIDKHSKKAYAVKTIDESGRLMREMALLMTERTSGMPRHFVDMITAYFDRVLRTWCLVMECGDCTLHDVRGKVGKRRPPTPKEVEEMMGEKLAKALRPLQLNAGRLPPYVPDGPVKVQLHTPIPDEVLACVLLQFARGLVEAQHMKDLQGRKGLLHNDIKLDNFLVFLTSGRVKYADLGCSTWLPANGESHTPDRISCGKYQSPERLEPGPPVTAKSDVWAAGLAFLTLALGLHPFETEGNSKLLAISNCIPHPKFSQLNECMMLPERSRALHDVIVKMCACDVKDRATPKELLETDLLGALKDVAPEEIEQCFANYLQWLGNQ
jgi:serine/threonine protein kinase